jgi:hypothetical protein
MGLLDRFTHRDAEAEARYKALLNTAISGNTAVLPELASIAAEGQVSERQRRNWNTVAVSQMADRVLADEVMTVLEEDDLLEVAEGLGFTQADLNTTFTGLMKRLVLARANDGRLPVMDGPQLMAQADEIVHGELPAALMKQVALREFRGGSAGFSFRVAKGVRFRTGSFRGHSVVVGTQLKTVDTGVLSITNKRVVFLGAQKTVESKYSKLVGVQVYSDAVSLSVSNRQNASLFTVEDGPYIAAIINAAAQQDL